MKTIVKRVQLIHRRKNGECTKFWQTVDLEKMITLEQLWNDINQHLGLSAWNSTYQFSSYQTKQVLPAWYHVDLLNDNDQILLEEFIERAPLEKQTISSTPMKTVCLKTTSKKKQLNTYITNRSFIITNKYSVPNDFYRQWDEGKMHQNTNNSQMIF